MNARHHLIVRADILRPPTEGEARDWLWRLVPAIGMNLAEIPGNPLVYDCDTPGNRGLTATAIIETSNITLHTWDEKAPAELQLDVFTCGDLDADAVLRFVGEFEPVQCDAFALDRRDGIRWHYGEQPKIKICAK
jgi:S-adenosylmethionine/arginine decarboxylase-like enzyme